MRGCGNGKRQTTSPETHEGTAIPVLSSAQFACGDRQEAFWCEGVGGAESAWTGAQDTTRALYNRNVSSSTLLADATPEALPDPVRLDGDIISFRRWGRLCAPPCDPCRLPSAADHAHIPPHDSQCGALPEALADEAAGHHGAPSAGWHLWGGHEGWLRGGSHARATGAMRGDDQDAGQRQSRLNLKPKCPKP